MHCVCSCRNHCWLVGIIDAIYSTSTETTHMHICIVVFDIIFHVGICAFAGDDEDACSPGGTCMYTNV